MKVFLATARKADGSVVVLYAGDSVEDCLGAYQEGVNSPKGLIEVACFRKPPVYKRRRFESEAANDRWAKAAEEKARKDAIDHENAKVAAARKAAEDKKAAAAGKAKEQSEAAAKLAADEAARLKSIREQEVELERKAAARAAARARKEYPEGTSVTATPAKAGTPNKERTRSSGPAKAGTPNTDAPEVL